MTIGDRVTTEFRLERLLGEGGMGRTFLARDTKFGRTVVVKTLRRELLGKPTLVRRFKREVRILARLDHPNIVRLLVADLKSAEPWFIMEHCQGGGFDALGREVDDKRVLALFLEACEGVMHAHAQDVIHRDIKPSNLLIGSDDRCRVADFGLAMLTRRDSTALTRNGAAIGTPRFRAPEQTREAKSVGPAADVYSLAATLRWALIEGRARRRGGRRRPRRGDLSPKQMDKLTRTLGEALHGQADKRIPSVDELRKRVREVCDT
jgi:serine/threonine-protein kinase